jgi:hypothetical protein
MIEGSGSGSRRPTNLRTRQIRIRIRIHNIGEKLPLKTTIGPSSDDRGVHDRLRVRHTGVPGRHPPVSQGEGYLQYIFYLTNRSISWRLQYIIKDSLRYFSFFRSIYDSQLNFSPRNDKKINIISIMSKKLMFK